MMDEGAYRLGKKLLAAALLLATSLYTAGCGGSEEAAEHDGYQKVKLVMTVNGTNLANDTKAAMKFAELVKEESGGNVLIDIFPNDQLAGGNMSKGVEMVADGAVDMAAYATSVLQVLDERISVGTMPWTFNNYQDARKIIDSTGGDYYTKLLANQGLTYLGSTHNGFRQISNSKRAVKTPEDVQGLKIRVPGSAIYMAVFREFGADPVAMSWGEAFTAIQQGTIDGQENGFSVTNSAKVNEIQKYMTVWNYTYESYLFVINSKVFDALEPKTQDLIRRKSHEACEWGRDQLEADEGKIREKFVSQGMEVTVLTPEQLAPFRTKMQPVLDKFKGKYGEEACSAFGIQ